MVLHGSSVIETSTRATRRVTSAAKEDPIAWSLESAASKKCDRTDINETVILLI